MVIRTYKRSKWKTGLGQINFIILWKYTLGVSNEKAEVENGFIKYIPAKYKDQMEDQISHAYVRSVPWFENGKLNLKMC